MTTSQPPETPITPTALFTLALGLQPPWTVTEIALQLDQNELHLTLDFPRGSRWACPQCARPDCPVHDTETRQWRHLNFFQYACYLQARQPRVQCPDCGVKTVAVPWARPGMGFTLLFEAFALTLMQQMPVRAASEVLGEWDTRLWRVLEHYVQAARDERSLATVTAVGMDETAARRGHHYVTLFVDTAQAAVVFATPGKDATTVERFAEDLAAHGGDPAAVAEVTMDMSPAFIKGVTEQFPGAEITFDKFHVMKLVGEAVDSVRRQEQKDRPELKGTRYLWLRNPETLRANSAAQLATLRAANLKTARAYAIKETLKAFWDQPVEEAEAFFRRWYVWATHSRLEPIRQAAKTIKAHWAGVLHYVVTRKTNAVLEGINSLVQAAKARARGYRNIHHFITMIYLLAGKLSLPQLNLA